MNVILKNRISADYFMAMPDVRDYELIRGSLVARKPGGAYASHVAAQVVSHLNELNKLRPTGWVFGSEALYRCFDSPDTLRRASASVIRYGRLPGEQISEGYLDITPDLVVVVSSPCNTAEKIEDKVMDFLGAGVELTWVVYPRARTVHVRRKHAPPDVLDESRQLDGGTVLPGFSCAIKDIFPPKPPQTPARRLLRDFPFAAAFALRLPDLRSILFI